MKIQQLFFETAWDKTISQQDRTQIEELFQQTQAITTSAITFVLVRTAVNHREELLVTALIHNFTEMAQDLTDSTVNLCWSGQQIATLSINDSRLQLPAKTSMPWTFIYPSVDGANELETSSLHLVLFINEKNSKH